jgi:hypothetical protein
MNNYYPSNITLTVLKNKIYLLKYDQHGRTHKKILTKAACVTRANDPNVSVAIRDCIIEAFEEGVIE